MKNRRLSIFRLIGILAIFVVIMACSVSLPDNSAEDASSLSIVISNPLGDIIISTGEEVAITSTAFSEAGVDHVELLVSGQVAAISTALDPESQTYIAVMSWIPDTPGSYNISATIEDVEGQRAVSDFLTVTVEEQADEQSLAPTSTNPPPAPTNAPAPTSTQLPTVTIEPSPTSSGAFTPLPIIVSPIPIILTPNPTSGFIFSPIPIIILPSGPPTVHFVMETVLIPPGAVKSVTAQCPEGSVVTGGGYYSITSFDLNILGSRMNWPDGWKITAKNVTNSDKTLGVLAVCLSNSGGSTSMVQEIVTVQPDEKKSISAACPAGSVVTGGGWSIPSELRNRQSSQSGNNWIVRVENYSNSSTQARAYAICLSGTNATSYQFMESLDIGAGKDGHIYAFCQPGQLITGGGFYGDVILHTNVPIGPNATGPKYGWAGYADNPAHHTTFNIKVYATCLEFP